MRNRHARKLVPVLGTIVLLLLLPSFPRSAAASTWHGATGIMIPLYEYPDSGWSNLIWAKQVNPNVPIVAIINPDGGPGYHQDPTFVHNIDRLKSAGITVLGYVWTNYAARSVASVEADIVTYKNWYGVNGIYFDQMSNVEGFESYYSTLTTYTESLGMAMTVGNPGTHVPNSYIGSTTSIVTYEGYGTPSIGSLSGLNSAFSKSNYAVFAYEVPSINAGYLSSAEGYVGYIYLTDGSLPNPYAPESSYLDNLATALQTYDVSATASTSGTVSVTTVDQSGHELWGLYATLWQNGVRVQSCFSPCSFTVQGGQSYSVKVSDYGQFAFSEWANGLHDRFYPIVEPNTATRIGVWAIYNT